MKDIISNQQQIERKVLNVMTFDIIVSILFFIMIIMANQIIRQITLLIGMIIINISIIFMSVRFYNKETEDLRKRLQENNQYEG